jgi:hypothetical protein
MNNPRLMPRPVLWLVVSILCAASMGFYVTAIWSANQPPHFSDLYARWWGAHELLLHGRNPYSPEVSHEIQSVIYGVVNTASPDDPAGIGGGFAYPPYTVLWLWPLIYLSFATAQKVFIGAAVLLLLLSLALWMRALHWRPNPIERITIALFLLGSFPAMQALVLQNPSVVAAGFIAIAIFLLSAEHLVLAGVFLAASTFKPQFCVALLPWLAIWVVAEWRRRASLAWGFLGTTLILFLASEWLVPGWIPTFLNIVRAYRRYAYGYSLLDVWFTPTVGPVLGAVALFAVLALCWRYRSEPANSPTFLLAVSLVLAVNVVVMPTLAPHAQLLLLPGLLCLLGANRFGDAGLIGRRFRLAAWGLLAWPWVVSFALLVASVRFPVDKLIRFWQVPLYTSPLLPLAVSLALGWLLSAQPRSKRSPAI